jgi:hypothetical protein
MEQFRLHMHMSVGEAQLNCDAATNGASCLGTATVLLSCFLLFDNISQNIFLLCFGTLEANYPYGLL